MSDQSSILMAGLPESGKSTYLGALYYLLRAAADPRLRLLRPPAERDYLQELENNWLRFNAFERSRHPAPKQVDLELGGQGREASELSIPDVTGESYNLLWEDGVWSAPLLDLARSADGLLLFIRADNLKSPELIDVAGPPLLASEPVDWHPSLSPTQAKLCDLLESIGVQRGGRLPSVAVLISAWDEAADLGLSPARWLELQAPLLWQRLHALQDEVPFAVFGISAQGGDVRRPEVRERLAKERDPLRRLLHGSGADGLIDPLLWLLDS
jgi:Double-GTPase 1